MRHLYPSIHLSVCQWKKLGNEFGTAGMIIHSALGSAEGHSCECSLPARTVALRSKRSQLRAFQWYIYSSVLWRKLAHLCKQRFCQWHESILKRAAFIFSFIRKLPHPYATFCVDRTASSFRPATEVELWLCQGTDKLSNENTCKPVQGL